jgi:hypothetical protein
MGSSGAGTVAGWKEDHRGHETMLTQPPIGFISRDEGVTATARRHMIDRGTIL